ncbi:MAG: STAS domain-containing protein [Actinobacteria bacterium]|nr:STAS domain-containing protein [Actinomycetota bacterium]
MEIVPYVVGEIPMLSLAGEFDRTAVPEFSEKAEQALGPEGARLVIQLTDCPYIDSGGIGCLLGLLQRVRNRGWLGLLAPSPDVLRLFELVGLTLDPHFRVLTGLDQISELEPV